MGLHRLLSAGVSARAFDVGLGLSALSWALLGLTREGVHDLALRAPLAALNLCAGLLFLLRSPALEHGGARELAGALPSMLIAGLAYRLSPPSWPTALTLAFGLGALGTIASLAALGRSFAVLPSRRVVVERGPYRLVRHPAYACELVMIVSASLAGAWGWALVPLALGALALRVHVEERFLDRDPSFRAYARRVPARLVPYVF